TGSNDVQTREVVLRTAALPSMKWLGMDLEVNQADTDIHLLRILSYSKLRRLKLSIRNNLVVPLPQDGQAALPPLRELNLEGFHRQAVQPVILFQQWAESWLNLETVRDLTLSYEAAFPDIPQENQLEILRCRGVPNLDAVISSLPRLTKLKHLAITCSFPSEASYILEMIPSPRRFIFLLEVLIEHYHDDMLLWVPIAKILNVTQRPEDRESFVLRFLPLEDLKWHASIEWIRTIGLPLNTLSIQVLHYRTKRMHCFTKGSTTVF
ncbi:hypothetical protein DL96DRAFT_1580052, partial [Flagelloscypha sp. PMI_526]